MAVPLARYKRAARQGAGSGSRAGADAQRHRQIQRRHGRPARSGRPSWIRDNYPESLKQLVDGIKATGSVDKKIKYLRRIPKDPMTNSYDWGMRSTKDDLDAQTWGGQNVFDVYTKSIDKARDGTPYSEWWDEAPHSVPPNRARRAAASASRFVELMIVMAIIAVLLSVALPIYTRSIRAPRRAC